MWGALKRVGVKDTWAADEGLLQENTPKMDQRGTGRSRHEKRNALRGGNESGRKGIAGKQQSDVKTEASGFDLWRSP